MHIDRWMDTQSSFNRYSAGCECATTCDTKSDIVAGQNWERVREKSTPARTCAHTHTHTHTQIIEICGFRDDSWEGGSTEFALH